MNSVFITFLSLSLSGSLLILVLLFCKPFIKGKLSRQWQYYIWLIVIARLLLPIAPLGNLMNTAFDAIGNIPFSDEARLIPAEPDMELSMPIDGDNALIDNPTSPGNLPQSNQSYRNPIQEIFGLFKDNYWLIWLTVAVVLLIRKITIYKSFVRYVKAGMRPVSNMERLDQVALIGEQVRVRKPVELCVNPLVSSPLLIGFIRPCIVIPSIDISDRDFNNTILHEVIHYRRRDMFFKWLVQITICLHWFNPLAYLMGQEVNKACEFSCDEAVVAKLGADNAPGYGSTLLESMVAVGHYKESLASVTLSENKKLLKERLGAIMGYKKKSAVTSCAAVVMTILLLCGFTFSGAYNVSANELDIIGTQNTISVPTESDRSTNSSMYPLPDPELYAKWAAMRQSDYSDTPEWKEYVQMIKGWRPENYQQTYVPTIEEKWLEPINSEFSLVFPITTDSDSHISGYSAYFASKEPQEIKAISDGKVIEIVDSYFDDMSAPYHVAMMGLDQHIVVEYNEHIKIRYVHFDPDSYSVQVGQEISAGDVLGKTAGVYKGNEVAPYSCIVDILIDDVRVNPADFFEAPIIVDDLNNQSYRDFIGSFE